MRSSKNKFTKAERRFIDPDGWYESFQVLAADPSAASAAFIGRLEATRARCKAGTEAFLLYDRYIAIVGDVIENGVDVAMVRVLGTSGVLAGRARQARSEFYKTRRPDRLLEAIDLFVMAMAVDDDPLKFNGAMTVQGLAATVFDLGNLVNDRGIDLLVGQGYLTAAIGRLAVRPVGFHPVWADALDKAADEAATALDRATNLFAKDSIEGRFIDDVVHDLQSLAGKCRTTTAETAAFADLAFRLVAAGLAIADNGLRRPPIERDPDVADVLAHVETVVGGVLTDWIRRYAVDAHRVTLATTLTALDQVTVGGGDLTDSRVEPESTRLFRESLDGLSPLSDPLHRALIGAAPDGLVDEVIRPLVGAVLASIHLPELVPRLLDLAATGIGRRPTGDGFVDLAHSRGDFSDYLRCTATFDILFQLVEASIGPGAGNIGTTIASFQAILNRPDVPSFIRGLVGALVSFRESVGDEARAFASADIARLSWQDAFATFDDDTQGLFASASVCSAMLLLAMCPLDKWSVLVHDLGVPDLLGDTLALREQIHETSMPTPNAEYVVDSDVDARASVAQHIRALIDRLDLSAAVSPEEDEAYVAVAAAQKAGQISMDVEPSITLMNNLAVIAQRTDRHQDALDWLNEARVLVRRSSYLPSVAIISTNLANVVIDSADVADGWALDIERAVKRLVWLSVGLASVAQGFHTLLRIDDGLNPEGRHFLREIGFERIRSLGLRLLREFSSAPLTAEFILNTTNCWFYHELLALGTATGVESRQLMRIRGRSWLADAHLPDLPPQGEEGEDRKATHSEDLLGVLAKSDSDSDLPALWLGGALNQPDDEAVFSLVGPHIIGSSCLADVSRIAEIDFGAACDRLGAAVPAELWRVASEIRSGTVDVRPILYVSIDSGLTPISVGMWSCPTEQDLIVADIFDVLYCPSMSVVRPASMATSALHVVCDPLGDLPGARIVPSGATEVCGNAAGQWRPATRECVVRMIRDSSESAGIFLYQGHSTPGVQNSPGSAALCLEPSPGNAIHMSAPLTMLDLFNDLGDARRLPRMALLSCGSGASSALTDGTSIAVAAVAGGADAVVATLAPVREHDGWSDVLESLIEVLRAPNPVREFSRWQATVARGSAADGSGIQDDIARLALYGARLEEEEHEQ